MAAVSGHMASVGRVYISTDDLDRLRAERALCPALRARQPLREQLNEVMRSVHACQLNDALWTRIRLGITLLRTRRTQHHPLSAPSKHPSDAGPSWGPQSMMRHLAGLRWQSQRRRRRPSGQRRPSTKPSRGRAWVTHTAPKQPSLPSAEDGRAALGPPAAAAGAARTGRYADPDAAECFSYFKNKIQPFVRSVRLCG